MKNSTNRIRFYCALQLLSIVFMYNLVQSVLCQAKVIEEPNPHLVKLKFMDNTILPNDQISLSIDISSASKLDPTKYGLEIIALFVGNKGNTKGPRTERRVIPLKSLLDEQKLSGEGICTMTVALNAFKIIATSMQTQAYTLVCRIVDKQGQRVSNEITKSVLTSTGRAQRRRILYGVLASTVLSAGVKSLVDWLRFVDNECRNGYYEGYQAGYKIGYNIGNVNDYAFLDPHPDPNTSNHYQQSFKDGYHEGFCRGAQDSCNLYAARHSIAQFEEDIKFCSRILALDNKQARDLREISRAYRRQALKHHPDKNKNDLGAPERFKIINNANDFLVNSATVITTAIHTTPEWLTQLRTTDPELTQFTQIQ